MEYDVNSVFKHVSSLFGKMFTKKPSYIDTYKSLRFGKSGGWSIDPEEVRHSLEFKRLNKLAKDIVMCVRNVEETGDFKMNDDSVESVVYFTAMDGIFGEAANNCDSSTIIGDVVYLDGTSTEQVLREITFCVIVFKDGTFVTGQSGGTGPETNQRQAAYRDAESNLRLNKSSN